MFLYYSSYINYSDINYLKEVKSSTPLAFGGGIRNLKDLDLLEGLPVERFILSSALFYSDLDLLHRLRSKYGEQSIVGFIPFSFKKQFQVFNSTNNNFQSPDSLNKLSSNQCLC